MKSNFYVGLICALLVIVGLLEYRMDGEAFQEFLFPFQRDAFVQLGSIGLLVVVFFAVVRMASPRATQRASRMFRIYGPKVLLSLVVFFAAGEIILRVIFWDGAPFNHGGYGAITRRFGRDFQINSFDGSRGPDDQGEKKPGAVRILVQGDSITWGQGIKHERDIYTGVLLRRLKKASPGTEMAVIAGGGWEIDTHEQRLIQYGEQIQPDIILYQWFINDVELHTKRQRPGKGQRIWRRLFCHPILMKTSFSWFFADYRIDHLLRDSSPSYSYADYLLENFADDTSYWYEFERVFRRWAAEAKRLSPRVLVFLMPSVNDPECRRLDPIHVKVRELCQELEIESLDLTEALGDLIGDRAAFASPYDQHPNAMVHARVAEYLHRALNSHWPDMFQERAEERSF